MKPLVISSLLKHSKQSQFMLINKNPLKTMYTESKINVLFNLLDIHLSYID